MSFPSSYAAILEQIDHIDPVAYARTRNFQDGAITRLSPYISRGVISTRIVFEHLLRKGYRPDQSEKLIQELCWRDYFQRIGQVQTEQLFFDSVTDGQPGAQVEIPMPSAIVEARTGIDAVDNGIRALYETGYMHNHMRMYVASIATNMAGFSWQGAARWMYYHLLDADFASNNGSWQWVSGIRSKKKYIANQENINRYFYTQQRGTWLDRDYLALERLQTPPHLREKSAPQFAVELPRTNPPALKPGLPLCIYTPYNLDPLWRANEDVNRVLLLEPRHFTAFPMHENSIAFLLALAKNIGGLQVYTASFEELAALAGDVEIHFKEHPLFRHYRGIETSRDWIAPDVTGYYPSFFAYWKKVAYTLRRNMYA